MNNKFTVGVTSPSFCKDKILRSELLNAFPNSFFNPLGKKLTTEEVVKYFKSVNALILSMEKVNIDLLTKLPNLRIISKFGVGIDNIDTDLCEKKGIVVSFTPGINKTSVAEMTIGFMITLSRNMYQSSIELKSGIWNKSNGGHELSGKNIGIIGCNHIGQEVIRMLKPFNCHISIYDIDDKSEFCKQNNVNQVDFDFLISNSDIISLHIPLNEKTRNLINANVIRKIKKNAILINTSRGGIINEHDLYETLKDGHLCSAAIDAYEIEPAINNKLVELPNVFCTPHIGGNSKESILKLGRKAIENIKDFIN